MDAQLLAMMSAMQAQQPQQAPGPKVLLEFRVGCMDVSGKTVTADPRRGRLLFVAETPSGAGKVRIQWKLRKPSDKVEKQMLIVAGRTTWTKVPECKDGRVYCLDLNGVKSYWWLQEPTTDDPELKKDQELEKKIAEIIASQGPATVPARTAPPATAAAVAVPATTPSSTSASVAASASAPEQEDDEMGEDDEELARAIALSLAAGAEAGNSGNNNSGSGASTQASESVSLLQGDSAAVATSASAGAHHAAAAASPPAPAASSSAAAGGAELLARLTALAQQLQAHQSSSSSRPTLGDVLDSSRVTPLLENDLIESLVSYLPEGQRSPENLREQLRSPQLRQTLQRMTEILNSPTYGQLLASLSLDARDATDIGVLGFIQAIQSQVRKANEKK